MSDDKHTGMRGTVDRATDMMGGMMGRAEAAAAGGSVEAFARNAALGDLYEIKAARIALDRARGERVRALAQTMIEDHQAASAQLRAALRDVPDAPAIPDTLDGRRATMIEHLEKAADEDFDGRYLEQQEMAHKETITLFETFAERGDDQRLKQFAAETLPILRRHGDAVRALRAS